MQARFINNPNRAAMKTFAETQQMPRPWMPLLFAIIWVSFIAFMFYVIDQQLLHGHPVGDEPMSDTQFIIFAVIMNLILAFMFLLILKTSLTLVIDNNSITFQMPPFVKRKSILFSNISHAYVRKYHPVSQYGGWGIRGFWRVKAYNVSGRYGIQIVMKNGTSVLIGVKNHKEAETVLTQLGYNKKP